MPEETPASPQSSTASPAAASDPLQNASAEDRLIYEYLRARGYSAAEKGLLDSIESSEKDKDKTSSSTVSVDDLIRGLAVYAQKASKPGDNVLRDKDQVVQELGGMGTPQKIQSLIASLGQIGAEEVLKLDPTDKHEGYRELEAWVDGSLDMYRPEFRPILFPIFCHFYLDLVHYGFKEGAMNFFSTFSPSLAPIHKKVLHHLSTLRMPIHVQNDDLAQRFRNEKYVVRMSRSGLALLVGWLTEGIGGEALGAGDGFTGETGKRGRASVMRVVNNHLQFNVTSSNTTSVSLNAWEEGTGLLSSLIPQTAGAATVNDPNAFNTSKGPLKLGPVSMPNDLRDEAERVLKEQAMVERDPSIQLDRPIIQQTVPKGLVAPAESDLLPHPSAFRTVDVNREVEKVRDARKRIRLDPQQLGAVDINSPQATSIRSRVLPSICAYTLHDVPDGCSPCATFSADNSLMAVGFSESYIRLWNLKGEKLKGLRSDFQSSSIKDSASIRKIREKNGGTTRKLIGHSGPVYALSFDPIAGSSAPPKFLLSASADTTTRLWSMDTLTNVVAYRGHQNPVWDVQWSPMGIYFATASRDRTARLWSSDRKAALRIYAGHLSDVDCLQFHPNSLYLATGSSDWTARLWDVQKGSTVRVFVGHQGSVSKVALSPDGRYLASAGEDLAINLWDLGSGKRIKKMTGHTASIYSLAFSAESSLLVSGGADWTVRCWDVMSAGGTAEKAADAGSTSMGLSNGDTSGGAAKEYGGDDGLQTNDLLATFPTKRTSIVNVQFTPRNLCLVAGSYLPIETR